MTGVVRFPVFMSSLNDVEKPLSPSNEQVLRYNSSTGKWEAVTLITPKYTLGFAGAQTAIAAATTGYIGIIGAGTFRAVAQLALTELKIPHAASITKLDAYVSANAALVGGLTLTLFVNGVASALTVTWGSTIVGWQQSTGSVTVVAGDLLTFQVVNTSALVAITLATAQIQAVVTA